MSKEAMKLALEALENSVDLVREEAYQAEKLYGNYPTRQGKINGLKVLADDHEKAITALREALAEQQEPIGYWLVGTEVVEFGYSSYHDGYEWDAIYTSPPAQRTWVGLSEEDRVELWKKNSSIDSFVNATEAKLKEKNT